MLRAILGVSLVVLLGVVGFIVQPSSSFAPVKEETAMQTHSVAPGQTQLFGSRSSKPSNMSLAWHEDNVTYDSACGGSANNPCYKANSTDIDYSKRFICYFGGDECWCFSCRTCGSNKQHHDPMTC